MWRGHSCPRKQRRRLAIDPERGPLLASVRRCRKGLLYFCNLTSALAHSPTSQPYCAAVNGTTLNRPCLTSGDSAKNARVLISASVLGFAIGFPTLIFT